MRVARFGFLRATVKVGLVVVLGLGFGTCKLDKSQEQDLNGPSDIGLSVQLRAQPDVVNADGVSQAVVELVLRDQNGGPAAGRAVEFWFIGDGQLVPSAESVYVGPIQTGFVMATDNAGVARVIWVAGTTANSSVFVFVRPYGFDATRGFYRSVQIWQQ